jgi:hypothetical protein
MRIIAGTVPKSVAPTAITFDFEARTAVSPKWTRRKMLAIAAN